jgi:hypothetical protein
MGLKLPTADTNFKQKQNQLRAVASNVYTQMGSTKGLILFPSPPIPLTALVASLNTYTTSLGAAKRGSKTQTETKNGARADLENALSALALYVTSQAILGGSNEATSPATIAQMRNIVLQSGFKVAKISAPVGDAAGIKVPIVKKAQSKVPGQLSVLLRQYTRFKRGTLTWHIRTQLAAQGTTPAGPWIDNYSTSGNIKINGLASGITNYTIAAIGGHNTKLNKQNIINFTPIRQVVVT